MNSAGRKRSFGVTQKDIAKALGVSQAAVAYALSVDKQHRIPRETVEKIHAKAQELDYRPQRHARILREGRSRTVGAVFYSGPYHAPQERVRYLAKQCISKGYQLIATDLNWFGENERGAEDYLLGAAVEGVILCNVMIARKTNWVEFFASRGVPVVALSSAVEGDVDRVRADLENAFEVMTRHHLDQGSRKIRILVSSSREGRIVESIREPVVRRIRGFVAAIQQAGGVVNMDRETWDIIGLVKSDAKKHRPGGVVGEVYYPVNEDLTHAESIYEVGYQQTKQMIVDGDLPDALLCSNDQMAVGAMSALIEHGVDVPGRIRVSGMDNFPFSKYCGIPLTTMEQPSEKMATWAIDRLVHLIECPEARGFREDKLFLCDLLIRNSTNSNYS